MSKKGYYVNELFCYCAYAINYYVGAGARYVGHGRACALPNFIWAMLIVAKNSIVPSQYMDQCIVPIQINI